MLGFLLIGSLVLLTSIAYAAARPETYYVNPDGNDNNSGALNAPLATLQAALDRAYPGDTIQLAAGVYMQDAASRRAGTAEAPITIRGPRTAVLKGAGGERILEIRHDYLTLEGFSIDGLWGDAASAGGYRNKLLYVQGTQLREGVNGLRILGMAFSNAGGECIRLRYFAHNNEIAHSTIRNCGVYDYRFGGDGKNGEGIYIGTAVNQRADGRNPSADPDASYENWIHHNTIDTQGNECINIKEGAWGNLLEHNTCTGQQDPEAAGINIQGNRNIVRNNTVTNNQGAGIRLGSETRGDGINNAVYANLLQSNQAGGIKVQVLPQGPICANRLADNAAGSVTGEYAEWVEPAVPCPEQSVAGAQADTQARDGTALAVVAITADADDGNPPRNTLDNNLTTRWSAEGAGRYIQYDLGAPATISQLKIAFHKGDQRIARFRVELSADGRRWTQGLEARSSGDTLALQSFDLPNQQSRYVRIVGLGNTENNWNSLTEVVIYGDSASPP